MSGPGTWLLEAGRDLVRELDRADVSASMNRAQVHPPGVWVAPQSVDVLTLGGGAVGRFHLVLVVSDQDDLASHMALAALLDQVLAVDVFGGRLVPVEPVDTSWALVVRDTPLPAYRLAVDIDLEEGETQ